MRISVFPLYVFFYMFWPNGDINSRNMSLYHTLKNLVVSIMRFVIPVMFYEITNVECVYSSNTTVFTGRI